MLLGRKRQGDISKTLRLLFPQAHIAVYSSTIDHDLLDILGDVSTIIIDRPVRDVKIYSDEAVLQGRRLTYRVKIAGLARISVTVARPHRVTVSFVLDVDAPRRDLDHHIAMFPDIFNAYRSGVEMLRKVLRRVEKSGLLDRYRFGFSFGQFAGSLRKVRRVELPVLEKVRELMHVSRSVINIVSPLDEEDVAETAKLLGKVVERVRLWDVFEVGDGWMIVNFYPATFRHKVDCVAFFVYPRLGVALEVEIPFLNTVTLIYAPDLLFSPVRERDREADLYRFTLNVDDVDIVGALQLYCDEREAHYLISRLEQRASIRVRKDM